MSGPQGVVLVVGASRGIGRMIAEHLVASGFRGIGAVRSPDRSSRWTSTSPNGMQCLRAESVDPHAT